MTTPPGELSRTQQTGFGPLTRAYWYCGRTIVRIFAGVFYRVRLSGFENVPPAGAFIVAANHQSHFDPPMVGLVISHRRPFRSIARSGLFKFKPFAWLIAAFGAIPVVRGKGDTAAMKAALAELGRGRPILIFPEGSRTDNGQIGEFMRGITVLLKRAQAPVVPAAIEGALEVWPRTRAFPRFTGRIAVHLAPAIQPDVLLKDGPDAALEMLRRTIEHERLQLRSWLRRETGGTYPPHGPGDSPYWEHVPAEVNVASN